MTSTLLIILDFGGWLEHRWESPELKILQLKRNQTSFWTVSHIPPFERSKVHYSVKSPADSSSIPAHSAHSVTCARMCSVPHIRVTDRRTYVTRWALCYLLVPLRPLNLTSTFMYYHCYKHTNLPRFHSRKLSLDETWWSRCRVDRWESVVDDERERGDGTGESLEEAGDWEGDEEAVCSKRFRRGLQNILESSM